ncbi:hypothetical protein AVEN_116531-1 [Araneus ventricosus]|uniref:Uncharacterized protein n=1 Tax=Araneus ventricosus TaxID=182803 RepID=A0A4Y2THZ5_ARAVE|nr:hypothetical protein AVEN_86124-1 [Araneus ventricosus]GBO00255.1 hypothetical protein AVEN_116531-1 [Araneus ventricosus]
MTPSPSFRATPTGGRLATAYDLACSRPHTRRIFSGIGFRACGPRSRGRELTTRPPRPYNIVTKIVLWVYGVKCPTRRIRENEGLVTNMQENT